MMNRSLFWCNKISALFLARIPDPIQLQIAQNLHLPLGRLPFKYLGAPLISKRLVDKMTAKIQS